MSENITFIEGLLPLKEDINGNEKTRVFIPSQNINVFPCSRRGRIVTDVNGDQTKLNCDPEARLNTERTNRLHTSINGFTDSFIDSFKDDKGNNISSGSGILVFALAGYHVEVKGFNPAAIATALKIETGTIYAHLSLHNKIPFGVANYFTEILFRQVSDAHHNYIDVEYSDGSSKSDFFMGVSFTAAEETYDYITVGSETNRLQAANLPLFSKTGGSSDWELVQTSLLPKVGHDNLENSVVIGELHVRNNLQVDSNVTIGAPDTDNAQVLDKGALKVQQILVPYDKNSSLKGFPNTEIKDSGIHTAYIRAESIATDGLAVGGSITITAPDTEDIDGDGDTQEARTLTTISGEYISTVGYGEIDKYLNVGSPTTPATTDGDIVAANNITAEKSITVPNTFSALAEDEKVIISGEQGLEVAHDALVQGSLTIGNDSKFVIDASNATATINVPTTINNSLTIIDVVDTPELKVNTIESKSEDGLTIDSDTTFNKEVNVAGLATLSGGLAVNGTTNLNGDLELAEGKVVNAPKLIANEIASNSADGLTVSSAITMEKRLIVLDAVSVQDDLQADNLGVSFNAEIEGGLTVGDTTKTPKLDVKIIENNTDDTGVNINDNLNVTTSHVVAVDTLNVDTVNSRQTNGTITVESPTTLNGKATLNNGLEVTAGDTSFQSLTAKTTKLNNLTVESKATTPELDVNIITSTSSNGLTVSPNVTLGQNLTVNNNVSVGNSLTVYGDTTVKGTAYAQAMRTPVLTVDEITSNKPIIVQQPLKVNKIDSDITAGLTIQQNTRLNGVLDVGGRTVLHNGLIVDDGDTRLKNTTINGTLSTEYLGASNLDVVSLDADKITVNEIWLDQTEDIQVPALELVKIKATNTYQLRFKFGKSITIKEE